MKATITKKRSLSWSIGFVLFYFFFPIHIMASPLSVELSITPNQHISFSFVPITPGSFVMGSPESEIGRQSNETEHQVTLTTSYYMQTTEVTQAQWKAVMGDNPSQFLDCDTCPVDSISWEMAHTFLLKMNAFDTNIDHSIDFRLPTESEWEYAARAESTTPYGGSNLGDMGWYYSNASSMTHPVQQKLPNAWGLYDMHGNVWELCSDFFDDYPNFSTSDPSGPITGIYRVIRGGAYYSQSRQCRSAYRFMQRDNYQGRGTGMRLVMVIIEEQQISPQHFTGFQQETVSCTLYGKIRVLGDFAYNLNDEIGVFVKDNQTEILVGAAVIGSSFDNYYKVNVYKDDPVTSPKDGALENDELFIKVWIKSRNKEYTITNDQLSTESDSFLQMPAIPPVWSESLHLGLLNINISNTPPVANENYLVLTEDTPVSLTLTGTDIDMQSLTYHITSLPDHGTITVNNASVYYMPHNNYVGIDFFEFHVSDGDLTSSPKMIMISINAVNDAPAFQPGLPVSVYEDCGLQEYQWINRDTISTGAANELTQNLSFSVIPQENSDLFSILPSISSTGILCYKTQKDAFGLATFNVILSDNGGTSNNGVDQSQAYSLSINIINIPDAPSFEKGSDIVVYETGEPVSITWATQLSCGTNESDVLEQFIITTDNASLFQIQPSISLDGVLNFQPLYQQTGLAHVSVQLKDNGDLTYGGTNISQPISFTITVEPVYYTLMVTPDGGLVNIDDTNAAHWEKQYLVNTPITIEAISTENWQFSHWSGSLSGFANPTTITMTENKSIIANFTSKTVNLSLNGNGSIIIDQQALVALPYTTLVQKNSMINIKAFPPENFLRWSGDYHGVENPMTIVMDHNKSLTAQFHYPEDWALTIALESDPISIGQYHSEIVIGAATHAYTQIADSPPSQYACHITINDQYKTDIKTHQEAPKTWIIAADPHGTEGEASENSSATLSWAISALPDSQLFQLIEMPDQTVVVENMHKQREYIVTHTGKKYYTVALKSYYCEYELTRGWNLISLPIMPETLNVHDLFEGISFVYEFNNGSYIYHTELAPYKGYWIRMSHSKTIIITGDPISSQNVLLSSGWHLLGPIFQNSFPKTNPEGCIEAVFGFDGSFHLVNSLKPGKGYFFKLKDECQLMLR
jgi:formylglycine-generating enzyme required for sulfatase activity